MSENIADYISATDKVLADSKLDITDVDTTTVGNYQAVITYKNKTLQMEVSVVDTTAPVIKIPEETLKARVGDTISIDQENLDVEDASKVTITFEDGTQNTTFDKVGESKRNVIATDASGNKSNMELSFKVTDEHDPVLAGISDKTLALENNNNLLDGITATDEEDGDLTSQIVVSEADLTTEG